MEPSFGKHNRNNSERSSSTNKAIEGVLQELSFALQKPPHYPKLGLLCRLFLQFNAIYIVVNDRFPWTNGAVQTLEVITFPILSLHKLEFGGFSIVWCVFLALLLGCIAFAKYVDKQVSRGHVVAVPWMMRVVRAVFGLFSAMPTALFAVIIAYASCQFGEFNTMPGANINFDYECFTSTPDKIVAFCASIIAGLLFVGIGMAQGLIYPSDPQSLSIFRRAHSKLESWTVLSQFALFVAFLLLPHYHKVFGVAYLVVQATLFIGWLVFQPLYVNKIQDMQVGLAALPVWTGICFLILIGSTNLYDRDLADNTNDSDNVSRAMSILLAIGAVPVAFGAYILSGVMRKKVVKIVRKVLLGVRDDEAAFSAAMHMYDGNAAMHLVDAIKAALIEVAARSVLGPRDANIEVACSVMRRGIIRYPQSVYLRLQYCKYLLRAKTMADKASNMVHACEVLKMSTDQILMLNLFKKEAAMQLRATQQRLQGGGGTSAEGFDEAEMKQRLNDAKVLCIKCTQLVSEAWTELQKDSQRRDKAAARKNRAMAGVSKFLETGEGSGPGSKKHRKDRHHKSSSSKTSKRTIGFQEEEAVAVAGGHDVEMKKQKTILKTSKPVEEDDTAAATGAAQSSSSAIIKEPLAGRSVHSILTALEKLREMECKADTAFEFLMEKCPESPEVLHEYAAYVRAVKFDEKGAKNLESRRDMAIAAKESAVKGNQYGNSKAALGMQSDDDSDDDDGFTDDDDESNSGESSGENNKTRRKKKKHQHGERISFSRFGAGLASPSNKSMKTDEDTSSSGSDDDDGDGQGKKLTRKRSILKTVDSDSEGPMKSDSSYDDFNSKGSIDVGGNQFESAEKSIAKERTELLNKVRSSSSKLILGLRVFTLLLLVLSSLIFWVFYKLEDDAVTATTDTDFSGLRRFGSSQFAYHTRNMQLAAIRGKPVTFAEGRKFIVAAAKDFNDIHSSLAQVRKIYSPRLRSFYDNPGVKVREVSGTDALGNAVISEGLVTGSQAADKLILAALTVAYSNTTSFINYDPRNPTTFPAFFFVIDNAMAVFQAMDTATILTVLEVDEIVFYCMLIVGLLCGVAGLVESYIIVAMFRPAVRNLFDQLGKTVNELSKVERTERSTLASRFRAMKEQAESQFAHHKGEKDDMDEDYSHVQKIENNDGHGEKGSLEGRGQAAATPVQEFSSSAPPSPSATSMHSGMLTLPTALRSSSNVSSALHEQKGDVSISTARKVGGDGNRSRVSSPAPKQQMHIMFVEEVGNQGNKVESVDPLGYRGDAASDDASTPHRRVAATVENVASIQMSSAMKMNNHIDRDANTKMSKVKTLMFSSGDSNGEDVPPVRRKLPPLIKVAVSEDDAVAVIQSDQMNPVAHLADDDSDDSDLDGGSVDGVKKKSTTSSSSNNRGWRFFGGGQGNGNNNNKSSTDILNHLTKTSLQRKASLERWYVLCFILVIASLIIVFALGYTSTNEMKGTARSMNNVCRRRDVFRGMLWMALELLNVYDPQTTSVGGLQRITSSEDDIRCYLQEMISGLLQIHEGNLDGVDGWNRAKARNTVKTDWNSACSVFTNQEDLYRTAIELGNGVVRGDDRMNKFMFGRGQCLADPGDLANIPSLYSNPRTAPFVAKFSKAKCVHFDLGEDMLALGMNRMFDEIVTVYENIAYGSAKPVAGSIPLWDFYYFIIYWALDTSEFGRPSEEFGLAQRKGALLMEARVFEAQASSITVISAAFSVLVVISLIQLVWLGSRVRQVVEDNSYIYILVQRMLRAAAKEKEDASAGGGGENNSNSKSSSNNKSRLQQAGKGGPATMVGNWTSGM